MAKQCVECVVNAPVVWVVIMAAAVVRERVVVDVVAVLAAGGTLHRVSALGVVAVTVSSLPAVSQLEFLKIEIIGTLNYSYIHYLVV